MRTHARPRRAASAWMVCWKWLGAPGRRLDRARGPARVAWMGGYAAGSSAMACAIWWATCLATLPDPGDPFDVAAFRAARVEPARNALAAYAEASALMVAPPRHAWSLPIDARPDAEALAVLEANRAALERFREGSERPDAGPDRLGDDPAVPEAAPDLSGLVVLARLEARRLLESGDPAGAWRWHRAAIRAACHVGRRGTLADRRAAWALRVLARPGVIAWAADARVDARQLADALDDLRACDALAPIDSETVRAEYLEAIGRLDRASARPPELPWPVPAGLLGALDREPEQSRRVIRLAFANWLIYAEAPPGRRPSPAARSTLLDPSQNWTYEFFEPGPDAPPAARSISPRRLGRWYEASPMAREAAADWATFRYYLDTEAADREALLAALAEQLARRAGG